MNDFLPLDFFVMIDALRRVERQLAGTMPQNIPISEETDGILRQSLEILSDDFTRVLEIKSQDEVSRRANRLKIRLNGLTPQDGGNNNVAVQHEVRVLRESIQHAFSERLFFCMPPEHAKFYQQANLFGADFAGRFPEGNKEVVIAANCYAVELYTACVFHLTRAVEIAARVMVSALGVQNELKNQQSGKIVPVKLCTWETLLTGLEKGVKKKEANISTSAAKRETYEFYSHAVSQFRSFKDAWRNKTAHKRATYQAGQAKDIMDNVKQFMLHLANRLKEPKGAKFE
jgi:hypothetical protein